MVVMILENVSVGLRGELTRWMLEPHAGVFVGSLSAMVRDRLWMKCCQKIGTGGALMVWSTNNEQGYQMRSYDQTHREVVDFDGLQLVREVSQSQAINQKARRVRQKNDRGLNPQVELEKAGNPSKI